MRSDSLHISRLIFVPRDVSIPIECEFEPGAPSYISPGAPATVDTACYILFNSTLRFSARPSTVLLSAIGWDSPYPWAVSWLAGTPFLIK
jgi:hypothetical protein